MGPLAWSLLFFINGLIPKLGIVSMMVLIKSAIKMWRNIDQAPIYVCELRKAYLATTSRFSLGGNREGEIPDPIPNSEVKPFLADGTVLKSMEE